MRIRLTLTQYFLFIIFGSVGFNACNKSLEEERVYTQDKTIESYILKKSWEFTKVEGVYHIINTPSFGYQVAVGDTVTFWYTAYTLDGNVFDTNIQSVAETANLDTNVRSFEPIVTIAGKGKLISGLDEGMLLLRDGEQATILFPSSLGFGSNAIGPVEEWSPLAYSIELIKVNGANIQDENAYFENLALVDEGFTKDTSGLYLKYLLLGSESEPTVTDTIWGWCKGTLPDGTVIEDFGDENQQIILSNEDIPEGVRLGFLLTKKGGLTELVIPSFLGFGNSGLGDVEPYQTLLYQIRFDSIK